jgi:phasin
MTSKTKAKPTATDFTEALAPVTDALNAMQNFEVPAAARDFVKQTAGKAKERAAEIYAGSGNATSAIESAVAGSLSEAAKISRKIQQAMYEDVQTFFGGIEKLAAASSLTEAFQIQSDVLRTQSDVLMARAKAAAEYLGKLVADNAKTAQDNLAKLASYGAAA